MAPEGRSCEVYDPTGVNRGHYGNVEVNVRRFSNLIAGPEPVAKLRNVGGLGSARGIGGGCLTCTL